VRLKDRLIKKVGEKNIFQFLLVRLKVFFCIKVFVEFVQFQFLLVRLKAQNSLNAAMKKNLISIPFGAIKRYKT